ncbi:MAG TPA: DUF433 domain-containing protein [Bryobacteraceae bacterium]|jgi:uncharacterized protein (DUF433 family)
MREAYVESRDLGLYVAGSKVSLDSIVYAFLRGSSPEEIQENWPVLSLEQVYGAITYYLANRASVDEYLQRAQRAYADAVPPMHEVAPELYATLQRARREVSSKH